jgi:phage-related holin
MRMKKLFRKFLKKDKGGVMLVLLIYFLLTSLVIIAGFVSPTVREYKISNLGYQSRQSYFLSESGSEDAIYRVKRGKSIGSNEMISLNGGTVSTDIITTSSTRELTSTSSIAGIERKVFTVFSAGVGADFSYGVQGS